jgi:GNAT superfamily N-acetyltransferase
MTSVQVTTWYLQLTDPTKAAPTPDPDPDLEIRRVELPSPELCRALYAAVGSEWYWTDRLGWTWPQWHAYLDRDELEVWIPWLRGAPAGYLELHADGDAVEIVSFGLLPAFVGRGLGKRLLDFAVRRAWSLGPSRVWLHTCSLDSPVARPNYEARGFEVYDEETGMRDVPDAPLEPWPGAGRP